MVLKPNTNAGFSAGVRYWLFFLLFLFLLRYDYVLCICLGAIGGIAGGTIVAWWEAKEDNTPAKSTETVAVVPVDEPSRKGTSRRLGFGFMRQRRRRSSFGQRRRLGWLFRRK